MTSPIDDLLAKAQLIPPAPYTTADLDAAEERLIARLADRSATVASENPVSGGCRATAADHHRRQRASQDLQALCETVLIQPGALNALRFFISKSLPEPVGARVLGSILHLAASHDSARYWWQYAAGAGDPAAAYCLYLYHQAEGEADEATWWHSQLDLPALAHTRPTGAIQLSYPATDEGTSSAPPTNTILDFALIDQDITILDALRVLRALRENWTLPQALAAVLDYVPAAVGFVDDDLELPLPDTDFVDHIETLTALSPRRPCLTRRPAAPLPARNPTKRRCPRTLAATEETAATA